MAADHHIKFFSATHDRISCVNLIFNFRSRASSTTEHRFGESIAITRWPPGRSQLWRPSVCFRSKLLGNSQKPHRTKSPI